MLAINMEGSYLACPFCKDVYKDPKYLSCYHTYCESCLVEMMESLVESQVVTCSECRKTSTIPTGGPKDLPNNFFISRIIDEVTLKRKLQGEEEVKCGVCVRNSPGTVLCVNCSEFLCNFCYEHHKYNKECQSHHTMQLKEIRLVKKDINVKPKAKSLLCPEHEMELNFYCETCEQLVCPYCTIRDHPLEDGHDHNSIKKIVKKHREELDKIIEPVNKMIDELSKVRKKASSAMDEIRLQANEIDRQIDVYYEKLWQRLQQQSENLKKELHGICAHKIKAISQQLDKLKCSHGKLERVKELNEAVKDGSDQEVLFVKKQLTEDVKRLKNDYSMLATEPVASACMELDTATSYENSFPQFAMLASNEVEVSDIPRWVVKGAEINLTMTKRLCNSYDNQIKVQVQQRKGGILTVPIKDNQDGSYNVSIVANQTGKIKLVISLNGQSIKGSPYSILVRKHSALNQPSKIVNDGGSLGKPWGITFGKDGMWAVADETNNCICIFDSEDQLVRKFGSKGNQSGLFNHPKGLSFDVSNNLYVVDHFNNRVQKFDITGHYLLQFGGYYGSYYGQLKHPVGITVYGERVFVVDMKNHRISVFQCDGQFSHAIESDNLNHPYDVAISSQNQVLVANWYHHCISIFSLDGDHIGEVGGTYGRRKSQLAKPCGVTTDLYGFIIVNEWDNNRVSIFDKNGTFIHCFGSFGSNDGQFTFPYGIAVSPNGSIYVTDYKNQRIQIFSNY